MLTTKNLKRDKPMTHELNANSVNPISLLKGRGVSYFLVSGLASILVFSPLVYAEQKDPAPISDEVIQYIHKTLNYGVSDPLITKVDRTLDRANDLVERFAKQQTTGNSNNLSETRMLLRALSAEFRLLQAEADARAPKSNTKATSLAGNVVATSRTPVSERFVRISAGLDQLGSVNEKGVALGTRIAFIVQECLNQFRCIRNQLRVALVDVKHGQHGVLAHVAVTMIQIGSNRGNQTLQDFNVTNLA